MAEKKYATEKGEELAVLGLDIKKLSRKEDGVYYLGGRVGLIEKGRTDEFLTFDEPKYTRVKPFNTMLGIILEDKGYGVRPVSSCHDYISVMGEDIAYTTRTRRHERIEMIEDPNSKVTKLRKLADLLN